MMMKNYFVPGYGFKMMDIVLYLNHSSQFNITSVNDGEQFEALRDIKTGEELLLNYGSIAEGLECLLILHKQISIQLSPPAPPNIFPGQ